MPDPPPVALAALITDALFAALHQAAEASAHRLEVVMEHATAGRLRGTLLVTDRHAGTRVRIRVEDDA